MKTGLVIYTVVLTFYSIIIILTFKCRSGLLWKCVDTGRLREELLRKSMAVAYCVIVFGFVLYMKEAMTGSSGMTVSKLKRNPFGEGKKEYELEVDEDKLTVDVDAEELTIKESKEVIEKNRKKIYKKIFGDNKKIDEENNILKSIIQQSMYDEEGNSEEAENNGKSNIDELFFYDHYEITEDLNFISGYGNIIVECRCDGTDVIKYDGTLNEEIIAEDYIGLYEEEINRVENENETENKNENENENKNENKIENYDVENDNVTSLERVNINITLTLGDYSETSHVIADINKDEIINNLTLEEKLNMYIDSREGTDDSIELDDFLEKEEVTIKNPEREDFIKYIILGLGIGIGIYFALAKEEKENVQQERDEADDEYSVIISKLNVLHYAGISVRECFERIAAESDETGEKMVYREIKYMNRQIANGMSETKAYSDMGKRVGTSAYIKLGNVLEQNVRKGGRGLKESLNKEAEYGYELKREAARRKADMAGNKLLMPMGLLLVLSLAVVIVPAILSINM